MLTRRDFTTGALASVALAGATGCGRGDAAYQAVREDMTQPLAASPDFADLVRFATLAANGHNTQPWRFVRTTSGAEIRPDFSRRTPIVDPDDHHLYASLGCAAENMSLAARARGLAGDVLYDEEGDGIARIGLAATPAEETPLFAAISDRQCTRADYDGRPVPADIMRRLDAAARVDGVEPIFLTEKSEVEDVLELVVDGNSRQIDDPDFVAELKHWIRFSDADALRHRDGLFSAASGSPTLPRWIASPLFRFVFTKSGENDRYVKQVRSSAGILVLVGASNDRRGWFGAGRAYQRFALQATAEGLKHAFVNQAVEVVDVRAALQDLLGLGGRRPDLVVRFGYGPTMPYALRRPPEAVIDA